MRLCLLYGQVTSQEIGLVVGIDSSKRWQRWAIDSAYTIGAVALASLAHFVFGAEYTGRTPFLVSMLAVLISATRGGFWQGVFATLLSLGVEIAVWGEWSWLVPADGNYRLVEIGFYLLEGLVISLLAEYYLNGRLALRHSQLRFQVLFDALPVGAMIYNHNRILVANKTLAEMFDYPLQEMIGIQPALIIDADSRGEMMRHQAAHDEEAYRVTGLRRDGGNFPIEVISRNIDYEGQPMRVMVMRDLTDHLIARQRLEQMNELLEARVEARTTALNRSIKELRLALENVKTLSGLLPICGSCKRIRDDDGYWSQVEDYISAHSTAEFSHSLCPECLSKLRDEISHRHQRPDDRAATSD